MILRVVEDNVRFFIIYLRMQKVSVSLFGQKILTKSALNLKLCPVSEKELSSY